MNHMYIEPRRLRLNGEVERSRTIDEEESNKMLDGAVTDDAKLFNDKLREWEGLYNYHLPHAALGGQTSYECRW
jgi:transposase InsO family protein